MSVFLWWYFLRSLKYKFILWGRWYWMTLYVGTLLRSSKKLKDSLMFLWCRNMYFDRRILGNVSAGFLQHFMPPWSIGLYGPYMWSYLTESSVLSGQFLIINLRRYVFKLDSPLPVKMLLQFSIFLRSLNLRISKKSDFVLCCIENSSRRWKHY